MWPFHSADNSRSRSTVQSRARSRSLHLFPFSRVASKAMTGRHSLYSKHFAAPAFRSAQNPRPSPRQARQRLSLRNVRRSLWVTFVLLTAYCLLLTANCLLVLRHHFFSTLKNLPDFTLLGHRQHLQPISTALFQLFLIDFGEFRKVIFRPAILDKLEW